MAGMAAEPGADQIGRGWLTPLALAGGIMVATSFGLEPASAAGIFVQGLSRKARIF
jgi:hypothetical protein